MRVIAGSARGRPLAVPPRGVRPTMDRVREAVFSSLGDAVPGARVLDLFAGSGALGIEALSRGAGGVVFVERDERCVRCLRGNLRKAGVEGVVQTMDAHRFLDLYFEGETFDIIFADPPYVKEAGDTDHAARLLVEPRLAGVLSGGGVLVLETAADRPFAEEEGLFVAAKSRVYGGTRVTFFHAR